MVLDYLPILIALLVILITFAVYFFYRKRTVRNGILITGLCDSGKTLIFSQLVYEKYVLTQTSMRENQAPLNVNKDVLQVYDIPGYERLRTKFLDLYKSSARAVIFVVDSSTIQKDIRDAAEYLYTILTNVIIANSISHLLIACNKQDLTLAKNSNVVQSMLEKELNALRVTKSSQLESVDPKGGKIITLGNQKEDFTFASLGSIKISFVKTCATEQNLDLLEIEKWLQSLV